MAMLRALLSRAAWFSLLGRAFGEGFPEEVTFKFHPKG